MCYHSNTRICAYGIIHSFCHCIAKVDTEVCTHRAYIVASMPLIAADRRYR